MAVSDTLKILGVTYSNHINNVVRAWNHHVRALRHLHRCLSLDVAKTTAASIVDSRIDYCNALLYGADSLCSTNHKGYKTTLRRLFATLVATRYTSLICCVTSTNCQSVSGRSWRDVQSGDALLQIQSAWSTVVHTTSTVHSHTPAATFRHEPVIRSTRMDCYWWTTIQPSVLNNLPADVISADSLNSFKTRLKTHLFVIA